MKNTKNANTEAATGDYGIKAYGKWHCFPTEKAFKAYLGKWIGCTEGSERDRAVEAYVNLLNGIKKTDTDAA